MHFKSASAVINPVSLDKSEQEPSQQGFGYIPFFDGLRAVSILLVLGFHKLGPLSDKIGSFFNGWIGVDLFFIVSGFLITSILLKEQDRTGKFSLKNFYIRRWLRLCPAFYAFLLFMLCWMIGRGQSDYAAFLVAGAYMTNLDAVFSWALVAPSTGLLHTWSLAVEEQFYLLWPISMRLSGQRVLALALSVCACVYFWRIHLICNGASWMRISSGFDTRIDAIMLGVLTCLLLRKNSIRKKLGPVLSNNWTQAAILGFLLAACHWLSHPGYCIGQAAQIQLWSLKIPLVHLLVCALIASLIFNSQTLLGKFLSSRPLVWLGKLSYSIYLWHVIFNFPQIHTVLDNFCQHRKYLLELCKYLSCLALASFSYYCIERPFLKIKSKFS